MMFVRTTALVAALSGVLAYAAPAAAIDIQEVTSPGGIHALLVEDYTNPLVAMRFAFKGAGTTEDPQGRDGMANLLSGLLDEGAGDIDSQAFQARLDEFGVSLSFSATYDNFGGNFRTIVANEDVAFDLLRLALNEPRLDEEPVQRIRSQIETGIIANRNDPGTLASEAFRRTVFPDHPYARPTEGTVETLNAVTVDDMRAFRDRAFAKDNLVIGVVGAIDAERLGKRLDEVFGNLPDKAELTSVPDVQPVIGKSEHVELAVPQTNIQIALPGIQRDDPEFFAAYLMNHILGGGTFSSRLYSEVREKRGLAYGVGSNLVDYDHAAFMMAYTATRADRAGESIDVIREQMQRLAADGTNEEELDKAKAYVKGAYAVQNLSSSLGIASTLVGIQLDGLGVNYINEREALIDAVTMDEVKAMADRLLTAEPTIVTVGPAIGN
ncbi:insulinase family protein [Aureimonas fodinaquatilis]|uniref:Insulinase family protein n=1 Tax=Aureimonas fodinaquatilis TaxID=2565783 RepID=A0A5B0E0Q1_9HYPH|nr:pitrilysin family protein [Aureimonas fodinaquatilis]KAA0972208.1 insulinase family protein [Aureimonas fodinaquatilis]